MNITTRKHGHDAYMFLKRRDMLQIEHVVPQILKVNGLTIKQAAHGLKMNEYEFLTLVGYLKRVGVIKEVGIK